MNWFQKAWNYLSGKKTVIGSLLTTASLVITEIAEIWSIEAGWIIPLSTTLAYIGAFMLTTGVPHTILK